MEVMESLALLLIFSTMSLVVVIGVRWLLRGQGQKCPLCGRKMKESYKIDSQARGHTTYKNFCSHCGYINPDDWLAK